MKKKHERRHDMIGPTATCEECGQTWDTWIGYRCPNCGTTLPADKIEELEKEHTATFQSMVQDLPPKEEKPKRRWWRR